MSPILSPLLLLLFDLHLPQLLRLYLSYQWLKGRRRRERARRRWQDRGLCQTTSQRYRPYSGHQSSSMPRAASLTNKPPVAHQRGALLGSFQTLSVAGRAIISSLKSVRRGSPISPEPVPRMVWRIPGSRYSTAQQLNPGVTQGTATLPLTFTVCTGKLRTAWVRRGWPASPTESGESTTPGTVKAARDLSVVVWSKRAWPSDLTTVTGLKHTERGGRQKMSPETLQSLNLSLRGCPPSQSPPSAVSHILSCTRVWIPTLRHAEFLLWPSLLPNRVQQNHRSHFPAQKLQVIRLSQAPFDPVRGA